ncbi:endopeptidase La [Candidatus Chloroploca asiatica]|uniref:Lon protease n=1 Tax=Candidatus Chloroploca asiatica TaxID=1506545 RepID=A0A2H3KIP2_9CHLR|nr:endopeptidase La [Candidatus Chloroploca asiatica]PDV97708.1 endopeptidase La [Candidatus Chloroploca asiatica]
MHEETPVLFNFPSSKPDSTLYDASPVERDLIVLPLSDTVLFPHMLAPIFLVDDAALAATDLALDGDRTVLALARRELTLGTTGLSDLYTIGVEAVIQRSRKMPDGTTSVVLEGRRRMRIVSALDHDAALRVRAVAIEHHGEHTIAIEAMMRAVRSLFEKVVRLSRTLPDDAYMMALNVDDPGGLADLIASTLPISIANRQQILETVDPEERLHRISTLLTQELDLLELESRIQSQVQKEVDRSQREFFLREQLKVIQRELGQEDPTQRELASLRSRMAATHLPVKARARAEEELGRLEAMSPVTPEYAVVRTYVEWILNLPWSITTEEAIDLRKAAKVLDEHHHGLAKVKDRILEFIAVRQLAGHNQRAPILCLVGPPGVGKTSLGRSIAEAIGCAFVRLSLGGVRDEAEIRGHRRTYIGAMPGRILQRMKEAGTLNPVFMLDEVDKLGADFRGDPADALLEVLDPEQNSSFSDHYLDLPFDLSRVFFVTTANYLDDIPEPLLDRMEVITLPGYTEDEKLQIARRFLVPRQQAASGLVDTPLRFGQPTLTTLIRSYTYEAGVRNLEREIGSICRKTARRIAEGRTYPRVITPKLVEKLLGPPRYETNTAESSAQIGLATGMVYTGAGGDTMPVEVSLMEGKGVLTLTGQLGEVMQESAQAALSYTRANATALGIDVRRFEKLDIHIHVPEGATPKEGPSAGMTIAVALISALTGRTVRHDLAMTGEITLRGNVLPIGGVKEKLLGALRAGITEVILPQKNSRDLVEVPASTRSRLTIHLVNHLDQVLELVLGPPPPEPEKRSLRSVLARSR